MSKLNASGSALVFSTYLGGSGLDFGQGIAVDSRGNVYVTGYAGGTFPTTPGAYQTIFGGSNDAFVSELNISGGALVYSTYLGSSGNDQSFGIAVDSSGNVYVTGYTSGPFPVTSNAYQTAYGGSSNDAFVSKLNLSLSGTASLIYSTYLGGSGYDFGAGIALDGNGNVYVVGPTSSTNFPVTSNAFQTLYGLGPYDAFVSKLNLTLNGAASLLYSTYLGGSGDEEGDGIAVDNQGNIYVTGLTASTNFPTTIGAVQTTYGGGSYDAFVSKLNLSLSGAASLLYSTYLGGNGADYSISIAVNGIGNAYVTGYTTGGFPTPNGAYQVNYGGGLNDAFLSKINIPIPQDTIGIFRSGTFYLRLHNSTGVADISAAFNPASKPYPVVGDWVGAGFDTIGVFDQSNGLFSLRNSNTAGVADEQFVLGNPNDMPLSGVWTSGFTHFGVGVFRPSNGLIYLKNNLTTGYADDTMVLGIPGDQGLAGDWNGDGQDSPGVYRASNQHFYLTDQVCNCSVYGSYAFQYGVSGDAPVVGDWIGQGHDGVGLFRQSNGYTYLRNSLTTGYADITFVYGIAGDVPVAGHWQLTYPPVSNPGNVLVPPTAAPVPNNGLSD